MKVYEKFGKIDDHQDEQKKKAQELERRLNELPKGGSDYDDKELLDKLKTTE